MNENEKYCPPAFEEDYYDTSDYVVADFEGTFTGELAYTQWGKHHNKIVFIDLDDGRKIVCHTWNKAANYFDLNEMEFGAEIQITLKKNSKDRVCLLDLRFTDEYLGLENEWPEGACPIE